MGPATVRPVPALPRPSTGVVKIFSGVHIVNPLDIALGAEGWLWFTNGGDNSIGVVDSGVHTG